MKKIAKKIVVSLLAIALCFSAMQYVKAEEGVIVIMKGSSASEYGGVYYVGDSGSIVLDDDTDVKRIKYKSSNKDVVTISSEGKYSVLDVGTSKVTVYGYDEKGDQVFKGGYEIDVCGDASNTVLKKTSVNLYKVSGITPYKNIKLKKAPKLDFYTFEYSCSNSKLGVYCEINKDKNAITVYASATGKGKVTVILNNKVLKFSIKVAKISISKKSVMLVKGKTTTIKIKKCSDAVKWYTSNKKVATVSSKGKVKGKKIGNSLIYAKVSGCYLGCAVSVVSKKMKKVVKKAYSLGRGRYSQPLRMKKGYYDCSSLVWRAYKKAKIYLVTKKYAPVAADLAKHFTKKKKRIKGGYSVKNVSKMKLRPGDLMFCPGARNGRYMGIYHVEMFTGYKCLKMNSKGKATLAVKWATAKDDSYYKNGRIMARPVK